MEKSEPALAPEWLRTGGNVSGSGGLAHHLTSSSSHSDASSFAHGTRNRISRGTTDFDSPSSAFLDRSHSVSSRKNSNSNGSSKHAYSSFSRSHRDRDREKDKDRSGFGDYWDLDPDPLGNLSGRLDKDVLRRSHSMISRKPGDTLVHKGPVDLKNCGNTIHHSESGVFGVNAIGSCTQKGVFDKDFPAFGSEDRQIVSDSGRVPSPGLSTGVQSLPAGSSALVGGEGWSSALAEVPKIIGGGCMSSSSVQQISNSASSPGSLSTPTGLNMAEALAQPPSQSKAPLQSSLKTQKLEELAIRQSRQLIPVTPSMPKSSALNSSDKLKPKTAARTTEVNVASKSSQLQPLSFHSVNQPVGSGAGHLKSDGPKKFLVLKPGRENGVASSPKDVTSPPNSIGNRVPSTNSSKTPLPASPSLRSPNSSMPAAMNRKAAPFALNPKSAVEKRPSLSQAQSRNDFFNLMRKKGSVNQDTGPVISSPSTEESGKVNKELSSFLKCACVTKDHGEATNNGDTPGAAQELSDAEEKDVNPSIYPDEEEAAFLRSLGWDENDGEEGLTEEEISAFYEQVMILKPSLKLCQDVQMKLSMMSESHATTGLNGAAAKLSTSDSRPEA